MEVYFDNASTTFPKPQIVADSIYNYLVNVGGNANRSNHSNSLESNRQLFIARERLCNFFNFDKVENVIFTNNITTSLNMLIKGVLKPGDHVITSSMEHNSVLRPIISCKDNLNVEVDILPCSISGFLDIDTLKKTIKKNTKLIIITHASNVTGSIQPLVDIGNLCKSKGIFFIVDSAQTAGVLNIDINEINANAIAFTGHKSLLGPQGIGGFIIDDSLNNICTPIIEGGTGSSSHSLYQPDFLPDKFEVGTLNMPGIIGLSASIDFINTIGLDAIKDKNSYLLKTLLEGLLNIDGYKVYGDTSGINTTSCISLNYKDLDPAELSFFLENHGIKNRAGLHCAPLAHETIGTFPSGTVRLSLGYFNTNDELDYTLKILNKLSK